MMRLNYIQVAFSFLQTGMDFSVVNFIQVKLGHITHKQNEGFYVKFVRDLLQNCTD